MVEVTPASAIEPRPVRYLAAPYTPRAALTLLEGDPGTRKSFLAATIAAAVTRGRPAFGVEPESKPEERHPSRVVVYLNAEDPAHVVRERAGHAGANLDKLKLLARTGPTPLKDVDAYRRLFAQQRPALVVLDPLQAFMGGSGATSPAKIRAVLAPIVQLADEHDVAILAVRHLSKGGGRSTYRGLGSIDLYAAARSVLRVGLSPRSPTTSVLVHLKHSYGPPGTSLEFEVVDDQVAWLGASEFRAEDLDPPVRAGETRSAVEVAAAFLLDALAQGPTPAKAVQEQAAARGMAKRTIERAKDDLGVLVEKVAGRGRGGGWVWRLPPDKAANTHVGDVVGDVVASPDGTGPREGIINIANLRRT